MAKGGGLSIDSDPIGYLSLHKPIVLNSFQQEDQYPNRTHKNQDLSTFSMDRSPPPQTLQFSVNLNCTDDHHRQNSPPPSDDDDQRKVVDERDFFADDNNKADEASADVADKMDFDDGPSGIEFNVNVSDLFECFPSPNSWCPSFLTVPETSGGRGPPSCLPILGFQLFDEMPPKHHAFPVANMHNFFCLF
jgi:hypothetical protein